jgi:hypothetical protein
MQQPTNRWELVARLPRGRLWPPFLLAVAFAFLNLSPAPAQSADTAWEKAAGTKMAFDVASVKQNKSGPPQWQTGKNMPTSNIRMNNDDDYPSTGGFFSATNTPLRTSLALPTNSLSTKLVSCYLSCRAGPRRIVSISKRGRKEILQKTRCD